jgi:hypothetical protein
MPETINHPADNAPDSTICMADNIPDNTVCPAEDRQNNDIFSKIVTA